MKSVWDTDNFDPYEEEEPWIPVEELKGKKYKKKATEFIGYTYKPIEEPNSGLLRALLDLNNYKPLSLRGNLQYLQLEESTTNDMSISSRFMKKQKSDRNSREFFATTTLLSSGQQEEQLVQAERGQQKGKYRLVGKKQAPSAQDDKKSKVNVLQKKYF